MTKTIKKSLLIVTMCLFAIATCFSLVSLSHTSANAAEKSEKVVKFEKIVAELEKRGTDYADKLANDASYYDLAYSAKAQFTDLTLEEKLAYRNAEPTSELGKIYKPYSDMLAVFDDAFIFSDMVTSRDNAKVIFSNFNTFAEVTAKWADLKTNGSAEMQTWISKFGATETEESKKYEPLNSKWKAFVKNWNEMLGLKAKVDAVIDKIDGILYAPETEVLSQWIDSNQGVKYDKAADVKKIHLYYSQRNDVLNGVKNLLMTYANTLKPVLSYDEAKAELAAILANVTKDGTLKYYDIAATTETEKAYSTTYVANYDKALADCNEQDRRVKNFVESINAIKDIKANADTGVLVSEIYPVVTDIISKLSNFGFDADWAKNNTLWWDGEVQAVKSTKAAKTEYFGDKTLYCHAAEGGILSEYTRSWSDITFAAKPVIDAIDAINPIPIDLTSKASLDAANEELDKFFAAEFDDLIKEGTEFKKVKGEKLIAFITNYKALTDANKAIKDQFNAVDAWVKAIDAINNKITVSDFDAIAALKTTFEGFDAIDTKIKAVITSAAASNVSIKVSDTKSLTLAQAYTRYQDLLTYKANLAKDIENVAKLMEKGELKDGKLDPEKYPTDIDGKTEFDRLVTKATEEYDKIANGKSTDTYSYNGAQAYLQKEYPADWKNYKEALSKNAVFSIEIAIAKFGDKTELIAGKDNGTISIGDYTDIMDAKKKYDAADASVKAEIAKDKYKDADVSYADVLNAGINEIAPILARIDAYIEKVVAIVDKTQSTFDASVAKQIVFDYVKIAEANEYYVSNKLSDAERADEAYKKDGLSCKTAHDLYTSITGRTAAVLNDFNTRVDTLVAKATEYQFDKANVAEYNALVNLYKKYDTNARVKTDSLDAVASQQSYFTEKYNVLTTKCDGKVFDLVALEEEDKTLSGAIDDLEKAIADLEKNQTGSLQTAIDGLKGDIADLKDVDAGLASDLEEVAGDLEKAVADLQKAITDGDTKAYNDAISALNSAKAALEAADADLQAKIDAAKETLEAADANEKAAREAADAAEKAAREAAIADLQEQLDSTKTLATIALIIGIVGVLAAAVAIVLFVTKK